MRYKPHDGFRVFRWAQKWETKGPNPSPKRIWHRGEFSKRQKARVFCHNRVCRGDNNWVLVHPDGTHEPYQSATVDKYGY